MSKRKGDKPLADWETEKIKRARKGAADLGARAAEVGDVFKPDPKTVGEASMFSTVADKVAGYFKAQANRARGGKTRVELYAERDRLLRQWAAELRKRHKVWSEEDVAEWIHDHQALAKKNELHLEAQEKAEDGEYDVAADIENKAERWGISIRQIRKIISRK